MGHGSRGSEDPISGAESISKVGTQIPARIARKFFYCPPLFRGAPCQGTIRLRGGPLDILIYLRRYVTMIKQ